MAQVIKNVNKRRAIVAALVERDGMLCSLCGLRMGFVTTGLVNQQHPWYRTIDHIVPPKKGGSPCDLSNLRLAHRVCNAERGQAERPSMFMNSDWWFMNAQDPDTLRA